MARRQVDKGMLDSFSQTLLIAAEKVPGHGEDFPLNRVEAEAIAAAVFDGCGGSGGRAYADFDGCTGAYVAARAAADAVNRWFDEHGRAAGDLRSGSLAQDIKPYIQDALARCKAHVLTQSRLKSRLQKDFPTTAALYVLCRDSSDGSTTAHVLWAGDSRCYLLDAAGLHQLTTDDVAVSDALSNIHEDGVMNNVLSASEDFELHEVEVTSIVQGIVFAASDGCFGYLPSPMHFEYLLLDTLMSASSLDEWESSLRQSLAETAGDDATLVGTLLGFDDFKAVQSYFKQRHKEMLNSYIRPFEQDSSRVQELWTAYKGAYAWNEAYGTANQ